MKKLTTVMIGALMAAGAQLAVAEQDSLGVQLSTTVNYAELDLSEPQAIEILHRRLSNAAEQVCAPLEGRELWKLREHRQCVSGALSQAIESIDRPMLTEYHQQKNGSVVPRVAAR